MPDALTAATALEHGMALVTRDSEDLDNVRGLRVRAWQPIDLGSRVRSLASGFERPYFAGYLAGCVAKGGMIPEVPL